MNKKTTCTKAEFARQLGINRSHITRAVTAGYIDIVGKGRTSKVKLDGSNTIQFIESTIANTAARKNQPPPPPVESATGTGVEVQDLNDVDIDTINLQQLNKNLLDRFKAVEDIRMKKQKRLKVRGELVERETVTRTLSKLFSIHVNQLRTLGDTLSPDIAAVFGSSDPELIVGVSNIVNEEVFKILEHIKSLFLEWVEQEDLKLE
jgi:hypothetical protein